MSKSRLLASSTHARVAMRARLGRVFLSIADDWGLPIADLSTVATLSTPSGVGAPTALGPMPPWKITAEPELQLAESYPALVLDEVPAENLEANCGHREEINGDEPRDVVA